VALAAALIWVAPARAAVMDWGLLAYWNHCWPDCVVTTCRDDYCPKPPPCPAPGPCLGCDDYDPKCMPRVRRVCRFECDDYRAKCEPRIMCPPRTCR
jgi:hypothetical protein